MYLEELYARLMEEARLRIRTGLVTERGLARLCGVSQPHMHNVLKNIRTLSPDASSRLMRALDLTVPQLVWRCGGVQTAVRAVPFVRSPIGPGTGCSLSTTAGYVPFPADVLQGLENPLAARLAADLVMPKSLNAKDLVLLDQAPAVRSVPSAESLWVVVENGNLRIRYIRMGGTRVYIANEATLPHRTRWDAIALQGVSILDVIRARIAWIGRDLGLT